jgi:hypothetical protein
MCKRILPLAPLRLTEVNRTLILLYMYKGEKHLKRFLELLALGSVCFKKLSHKIFILETSNHKH